ncbi:hypothetical protein [Maribellus mangrovi]|uniref:hypothetical protein n=1 Tax=Maribellus mangrovi TaxID=3133146 RepID=UPI0030EC1345
MINEKECTKILNGGTVKFSKDEVKMIRDLLIQLATIEYEEYKENIKIKKLENERDLLQAG